MTDFKNFTELDFDKIKNSIKEFLKNQEEFTDYNFEGSAMNVFLDVLAYNTLYNSFYANMTISERFLQYAQTRKSNVSLARNLGYVPRSSKSSKARISLSMSSSVSVPSISIPKGTIFVGKNSSGNSFNFYTKSDYYAIYDSSLGKYIASEIEIYEGKIFNYSYTIKENENGVTIPNSGIDTDLMKVFVKDSISSVDETEFHLATDYTLVRSIDNVYFLEEVDGQKFRIFFGDGTIGSAVSVGNVVRIEYQTSSGENANNINKFSLSSSLGNTISSIVVTTMDQSYGGSDIESIESIKMIAPQFYQSQNRAVTAIDYKYILLNEFSLVEDVSAWGGEDSIPPIYGQVFISIKPRYTDILSDTQKTEIQDFLKNNYSIVSIEPVIIDPEYLKIQVSSNVYFNSTKTNPGASQIRSSVINSISSYTENDLNTFDKNFRYSKFIAVIDESSSSIESNNTTITISKNLNNFNSLNVDGDISFNTSIKENSISSNRFNYSIYSNIFIGDENGILYLYRYINSAKVKILDNTGSPIAVGSVVYVTGTLSFDTSILNRDTINYINNENDIEIFAVNSNSDIPTTRNQIITIDLDRLIVKVIDSATGISVG